MPDTPAPCYFAYGSNLNPADLHAWCVRHQRPEPKLSWICRGYLPDRERLFDWFSPGRGGGVLNLAPRPGQVVPGGLYTPTQEDWITLDLKEGVGSGHYRRVMVPILTEDGREIPAITYEVIHSGKGFIPPTDHYLHVVKEGLALVGLDPQTLDPAAVGVLPPWEISRLFIYGTLRAHGSNRAWLNGLSILGEEPATVVGALHDLGPYPGLCAATEGEVRGELLHLAQPDQALARLDQLEGFAGFGQSGSLFRRAILMARTEEGSTHPAWVYLYAAPLSPGSRLPSGEWSPHGRSP